jgi:hypothetical protein
MFIPDPRIGSSRMTKLILLDSLLQEIAFNAKRWKWNTKWLQWSGSSLTAAEQEQLREREQLSEQ